VTTATCIADYMSWSEFSNAQKMELGKLYVPYLALGMFLFVLSLSLSLSLSQPPPFLLYPYTVSCLLMDVFLLTVLFCSRVHGRRHARQIEWRRWTSSC
jgi:hypothetical protein